MIAAITIIYPDGDTDRVKVLPDARIVDFAALIDDIEPFGAVYVYEHAWPNVGPRS